MKKLKLFSVTLIAVMLLAATPVKAADSQKKPGTLNIIHREGQVLNNTWRYEKKKPNAIDGKLTYDIHKNEEIEILVNDPNMFIYKYACMGIEKSPTEDYTAIEKFLEALKPFSDSIDKLKDGKKDEKTISEKKMETLIDESRNLLEKFNIGKIENYQSFQNNKNKITAKLNNPPKSVSNLELKRLQELLKEISDRKDIISNLDMEIYYQEKFYEQVGLNDIFFYELSKNISHLKDIAGKIQGFILATTIKSNMSSIAKDIKSWDPDLKIKLMEAYQKINAAQEKFLNEYKELRNDKELGENFFIFSLMITFAQDQKANIMALLDKVESFKSTFEKMNSNNPEISLGKVIYSAKEKITASIQISYINPKLGSEVEDYLKRSYAKIPKIGNFDFIFEPYIVFKYGFGVCQILSTFKNTDENGKEKNVQLQVPMLTITPQKWDDWHMMPNFQLGFTVKDDLKHLLLGPGIKILDNFYVGGGVHLRWGKDSLLKLGGYLNISFTPLKLN